LRLQQCKENCSRKKAHKAQKMNWDGRGRADPGGASSRAVKGGVEPPHSRTNGAANGYDFSDLL
jgi:hypothetical protein